MSDPLNQEFDKPADVVRNVAPLRGHDRVMDDYGGNDPLREIGNIGWKSQSSQYDLRREKIAGVNVTHSAPTDEASTYFAASSLT